MFIYVHICSYMFIYVHICSYMFIYVHICSYMFIYVHICSYSYMFIIVHICSYMFIWSRAREIGHLYKCRNEIDVQEAYRHCLKPRCLLHTLSDELGEVFHAKGLGASLGGPYLHWLCL